MEHTPLGVILIVAASLVAVALFNEHKQREAHYQVARKEYEASKWIIPPDVAARRAHTDYKSYRDEWRAEQDLDAQREMARVSWWQMWATWIGVVLLTLTLIETNRTAVAAGNALEVARDANKLAREIGEAQVGAYPSIASIAIGLEVSNCLVAEISCMNSGNSPARDVEVFAEVILFSADAPIEKFQFSLSFPDIPAGQSRQAKMTYMGKVLPPDKWGEQGGAVEKVFVHCAAFVTDVFGREVNSFDERIFNKDIGAPFILAEAPPSGARLWAKPTIDERISDLRSISTKRTTQLNETSQ